MAQDDTRMTIGWIGAGRMGSALAQRLLDAGYDVSVYNRTRSKAEPLVAHGAKIVESRPSWPTATSSSPWCRHRPISRGDAR